MPLRITLVALVLGLLPMLVGCSRDRATYYSSVTRPTTIHLKDAGTGEVLWTKPIPVQHRLVMDFDRDGEVELVSISGKPATMLTWKLYRDGVNRAIEEEEMNLPGTPVFVEVTYRPGPEYPDGQPPQPLVSQPRTVTAPQR